jgi:hypothetical protein
MQTWYASGAYPEQCLNISVCSLFHLHQPVPSHPPPHTLSLSLSSLRIRREIVCPFIFLQRPLVTGTKDAYSLRHAFTEFQQQERLGILFNALASGSDGSWQSTIANKQ